MLKISKEKKYLSKNLLKKKLIDNFDKQIINIIDKENPIDITEIGCGEGHILNLIHSIYPSIKLSGYDISADAIMHAREKLPCVHFKVHDLLNISTMINKTDMILLLEVLEHVKDYKKALEELAKVKAHTYVISVPDEPFFSINSLLAFKFVKRYGKDPEHLNYWSSRKIRSILSEYFEIKEFRRPYAWTICVCTAKKGL